MKQKSNNEDKEENYLRLKAQYHFLSPSLMSCLYCEKRKKREKKK
jgi:hypothetical protein